MGLRHHFSTETTNLLQSLSRHGQAEGPNTRFGSLPGRYTRLPQLTVSDSHFHLHILQNEADVFEPDFESKHVSPNQLFAQDSPDLALYEGSFWGPNYAKLLSIKNK